MKRITTLLLILCSLSVFGQSDTTAIRALINSNFPDNTSGYITPLRLRQVSLELMRSNANLFEENTFAESQLGEDSIKSDVGFYKWNGTFYEEVGLGDGTNWGRSSGFISPLTFTDKLNVDTARFAGNLYPDGAVNIGRSGTRFDTVFANVIDAPTTCGCVQTAKLFIPTAEVLTLNATHKAFGLTVPAGYYVQPIEVVAQSTYAGTAYATNTSMRIRAVGSAINMYSLNLAYTEDQFTDLAAFSPLTSGIKYVDAADVEVFVAGGDPTAGDSDITIYLTYILVEL